MISFVKKKVRQIRIGIIEDEMVIASTLEDILMELNYEILEPALNYKEGKDLIDQEDPDILLIDIHLNSEKDGIDLGHYVRKHKNIPIIYLTANSDSATIERAKPTQPQGYVVKPFSKEDLFASIEIALNIFDYQFKTLQEEQYLNIKWAKRINKIPIEKIIYFQKEDNYVLIVLKDQKKFLHRSTLREIEDILPKDLFIRVSKSNIVQGNYIQSFDQNQLLLSDGVTSIPISQPGFKILSKRYPL